MKIEKETRSFPTRNPFAHTLSYSIDYLIDTVFLNLLRA